MSLSKANSLESSFQQDIGNSLDSDDEIFNFSKSPDQFCTPRIKESSTHERISIYGDNEVVMEIYSFFHSFIHSFTTIGRGGLGRLKLGCRTPWSLPFTYLAHPHSEPGEGVGWVR